MYAEGDARRSFDTFESLLYSVEIRAGMGVDLARPEAGRAPQAFVEFERTAHGVIYEDSDRFRTVMAEVVQETSIGRRIDAGKGGKG